MTLGGKTEIYAVFPRLRDTLPGRKTSAISVKHLVAWYDQVVRPSAEKVFGTAIIRHWPLSYAHYHFKDRKYGKLLNTRYSLAAKGESIEGPVMESFLREIHRRTANSTEEVVQKLHGVRLLIQRQNDKLEIRYDDVFAEEGNEGAQLTRAIDKVIDVCFQPWRSHLPQDIHVDLAVELTSKQTSWDPYPLLSSHPYFLHWYLDLPLSAAQKICNLNGRKSEHCTYKAHRIAGLDMVAGLSYKTGKENQTQCRELKVYATSKEYTYSRQSSNRIQCPAPSTFLSDNQQVRSYFERLEKTLVEATLHGENAIRIECTLPLHRARTSYIIPDINIMERIGRMESAFIL